MGLWGEGLLGGWGRSSGGGDVILERTVMEVKRGQRHLAFLFRRVKTKSEEWSAFFRLCNVYVPSPVKPCYAVAKAVNPVISNARSKNSTPSYNPLPPLPNTAH